MPRRRTIVTVLLAITLAVLLAVAPFLPDSDGPDRALRPAGGGAPAADSAYNAITPAMRAEIDRVVTAGLQQPALRGRPTREAAVARQVRCATFEGQQYCLHTGWTDETQTQVQSRLATTAGGLSARTTANLAVEATGDRSVLDVVAAAQALPSSVRAAREREELTQAARSVAKVWSIRHEIEGVPYPRGFLARHPELAGGGSAALSLRSGAASPSASPSAAAPSKPKTAADYPSRDKILDPDQVAEQTRNYWCGPTSMQMIAWGWYGRDRGQDHWAGRLGTTTSGTDIGSMTRVINDATGWDRQAYAGPYITLDIGNYSYDKWYLLVMRHIHDYRAPIVLHPILLKKFYPYLDDDASGHFQVGRGYSKRGDKPDLIGYFEPWNQQRFDPSEPHIERVQWQRAYRSFRANKAHPFHNIGV
jgi:hypothetical protein